MNTKTYNGPERRQYFRHKLIYSPKEKARLQIGSHEYEVLDMSEGGLRFIMDSGLILEKQFRGVLILSSGKNRTIEGEIVWQQGNEIGVKFKPQDT